MPRKKAKRKSPKPDPKHINSGKLCFTCRAMSVFAGKCIHCDQPTAKAKARAEAAEKS